MQMFLLLLNLPFKQSENRDPVHFTKCFTVVSFNFVLTKSPNGPFLRTDFGVSCLQEAALSAYQRKRCFECEVLAVEVNSKY